MIMAGSTGYLPYYLAAEAPAKMKVLVDLDFLLYIHENIRQDGEKPLLYLTGYMLRQIASSWETTERKTAFDNAPSGTCCSQTRGEPGGNGFLQW